MGISGSHRTMAMRARTAQARRAPRRCVWRLAPLRGPLARFHGKSTRFRTQSPPPCRGKQRPPFNKIYARATRKKRVTQTNTFLADYVFPTPRQQARQRQTKIFLAALALYGLALYPILHADRFYIDDLGRSLSGYLGWGTDGRPLANVVMELANLGTPLVDLSPLPQLAAIGMFAWLATVLEKRFRLSGAWAAPLALLPLLASPFFLENLSYKFDALPMSLAACLAAQAGFAELRGWRDAARGAVAVLASLCLYQAAVNVFIVLALLGLVLKQLDRETPRAVFQQGATRILQLIGAAIVYSFIAGKTVHGHYASQHAALAGPSSAVETVWRNLHDGLLFVVACLRSPAGGVLLIQIVLAVAGTLVIAALYAGTWWRSSQNRTRVLLAANIVVLPAALLLAAWGPMLLLQSPVLVPRTQIGVGAIAVFCNVCIAALISKYRGSSKLAVVILAAAAYPLIIFASVYGNSLGLQKDYELAISRDVADDLARASGTVAVRRLALKGSAGMPPVVAHNASKFPLLTRLVPVHLTEGWGWAEDQFKHAGVALPYGAAAPEQIAAIESCRFSYVSRRAAYTLYVADGVAVVWFRNASPPPCAPHA
ncbi:hypothetical protein CAL13_03495 [Bordetella genomosp. 9]|uniref:Glucosyltransferase GtrII-like protein n=1 Tax=Bordetella genomosp. 9 TaxID=1416803 RepID=A0A1W6YW96_9BORD|nr:hypothetical protein CAL13_03495 [Bordetella genomosp. 9]